MPLSPTMPTHSPCRDRSGRSARARCGQTPRRKSPRGRNCNALDGAKGLGREGLGHLRARVSSSEKQALGGGIGFQQAGDHHGQRLGGGKGGRRDKGKQHRPHRSWDVPLAARVGGGGDNRECGPGRQRRWGTEETVCRWSVRPWAARLICPVLGLHLRQAAWAKSENLDVPQAVDALEHQGFQLAQPARGSAAPMRPARFDGNQGEHHADDQIDREQNGGKQGVERTAPAPG